MVTHLEIREVEEYARELEEQNAENILQWAFGKFGDDLGVMTALGYSGIVLMDLIRKIKPEFEVFFIDTGYHFPETLQLLQSEQERAGLSFNILKPRVSLKRLAEIVGPKPWEVNPDLCCHYLKVEPLLRVIHTKKVWLSALRRDQATSRAELDAIEVDGRGVVKIYPMVAWTYDQTWQYIREHKLSYNPLHDRGYPSVGCVHCTSPVAPGEHERAGRWNSMSKMECGMHLHRSKKDKSLS